MSNRNALVVDDHPTNRLLGRTLLGKMGWITDEADSGELALEKARQTEFALILLDISMPGLSGEETCARLRAQPTVPRFASLPTPPMPFPKSASAFLPLASTKS